MTDIVDRIIAYESGTLQEEEVYAFFQELLDTGTIDHLQGSYQRTAIDLLNAQAIRPPVRTGWRCDTGFEHDGTALEADKVEEPRRDR